MNCKSGIICNTETPKKVLEKKVDDLIAENTLLKENNAVLGREILKIKGVI